MVDFLRIKAETPEQLAGTLSGGNQQKVIFGKMLLTEARVLLLYDPTRGVDVGTKGEIFQLMRDLAAKGYAILFYSSDLPELVHVADRVLVLRNGRDRGDARGRGDHARRRSCGAAMLTTRRREDMAVIAAHAPRRIPPAGADWRSRALDRAPFLVACLMLAVIVAIYGSLQTGVFTLDELNLDTAAAMTLMLAATGQTIVLLRGGIDLSIGGMISLGTVIAATQFGDDPATVAPLVARSSWRSASRVGALNGAADLGAASCSPSW